MDKKLNRDAIISARLKLSGIAMEFSIGSKYPHRSNNIAVFVEKNVSDKLNSFLQFGTLPDNPEERCQLAWELCLATSSQDNANVNLARNKFLSDILKDVDRLDFTKVLRHIHTFCQPEELTALSVLCRFLTDHFQGSAIDFAGIGTDSGHSVYDSCIEAISTLLSQNPHLKSISFTDCPILRGGIHKISAAIGMSKSIESISFAKCEIGGSTMPSVIGDWAKNSSLKTIKLPNSYIGTDNALLLLRLDSLTSLDLTGNYITDFSKILAGLKNNTTLTSLNVDWRIGQMKTECDEHLKKNAALPI